MIARGQLLMFALPMLLGCGRHDRSSDLRRADTTRVALPTQPAWALDAANVLERQLQRELFNSRDTGYVKGARDCDEGGEDQPPPGLALVRATLAANPIVKVQEPDEVTVRTLLTSVARTNHHEGGAQEEVDVDVGVKTDTVDIIVDKQGDTFALCYRNLFLHRGHLDWPVVKQWTPANASWAMVTKLADSASRK